MKYIVTHEERSKIKAGDTPGNEPNMKWNAYLVEDGIYVGWADTLGVILNWVSDQDTEVLNGRFDLIKKPKPKTTFPCYRESKADPGVVVLFESRNTGTVVSINEYSSLNIGDVRDTWVSAGNLTSWTKVTPMFEEVR